MGKRGWTYIVIGVLGLGWLLGDDEPQRPIVVERQETVRPTSVPTVSLQPAPTLVVPETVEQVPRPPTTTPTAPVVRYVDATRLNVRDGPGLNYRQVWTLKNNEAVMVVGRSGDWRRVTGERYSGWVHGGYLTTRPATAQTAVPQARAQPTISAQDVRQRLIQRSIALYSGRCPCPYNRMSNGRRCGGNSAYSRPGGASPLCYESDVSDAMVRQYLARQ